MKINELLKKPFNDITDEEFRYIGKYFEKRPDKLKLKPKVILHKCINCKYLIWWDCLGWQLWKCLKNPGESEYDNTMTNKMITHKRKCDLFEKDEERQA